MTIPRAFEGAKYKRHAALTLPLFRRGKIVANFDLIVDSVQQLLARWRERPAGHVYLDMAVQAQDLLLTIFGLIAFDYDLETLKKEKSAQNNQLTGALQDFLSTFNTMLFLPTSVAKFYFQFSPRFRRAQRIIEGHFDRMIEQELTENEQFRAERKRTSLIASLVSSLQENETREASKLEEDRKGKQRFFSRIEKQEFFSSEGLSRSELLDEMRLFLLAGFETTSTALTWFIHLLSKHPEVQQKIKLELNNENETSDLSSDRLDSFVYLDCVIKEVFRFCPPINGTVRTLTEDDRLPESATQLFKGDQVLIPFHNLSHDPRYWSIDPHRFYPERFLTEDKAYHPYALIPFGSGHRQCIGQDLARFELKVIAATLMQHVTFGDAGPMINAGGQLSNLTITPKHLAVTVRFDQKRC